MTTDTPDAVSLIWSRSTEHNVGISLMAMEGRAAFEALLSQADVLVHGYRADALERLGLGADYRRQVAPHLIEVCHDAYGWSGPWALRRGFDSLVQMSSGIAQAGMLWRQTDKPVHLPVQALDCATGYFLAAAAVRGLTERLTADTGLQAKLSLARVGRFLIDQGPVAAEQTFEPESEADLAPEIEATAWGQARRVAWPITLPGCTARWDLPAGPLGAALARWV
jgi:crotonobetainyl-CoA:carnitine CoA-transferase CaiB-like acyl-CoA transferase